MSRVLGTAVAILTTVQFYVSAQAPPCLSGIDTFVREQLAVFGIIFLTLYSCTII